jgi:hypothetical protein
VQIFVALHHGAVICTLVLSLTLRLSFLDCGESTSSAEIWTVTQCKQLSLHQIEFRYAFTSILKYNPSAFFSAGVVVLKPSKTKKGKGRPQGLPTNLTQDTVTYPVLPG